MLRCPQPWLVCDSFAWTAVPTTAVRGPSYRFTNSLILRVALGSSDAPMKEGKPSRVIIDRFHKGEDILERLNELVRQNRVTAGSFIAIGAAEKATVGFFVGGGRYSTVSLNGPFEVLSCVGNVGLKEDAPFVHAHITFADKEGRTWGGHLMPGCTVDATFEVVLQAYDGLGLSRKFDPATELFLLDT